MQSSCGWNECNMAKEVEGRKSGYDITASFRFGSMSPQWVLTAEP